MKDIEVVDWLEYDKKEHVIAWFLLEAMSKVGIDKFIEKPDNDGLSKFDSSKITVDFKINGVRVSFVDTMEFLQSQLTAIEEAGKEQGQAEMRELIHENLDMILGR